jgi:hypothetical protein
MVTTSATLTLPPLPWADNELEPFIMAVDCLPLGWPWRIIPDS